MARFYSFRATLKRCWHKRPWCFSTPVCLTKKGSEPKLVGGGRAELGAGLPRERPALLPSGQSSWPPRLLRGRRWCRWSWPSAGRLVWADPPAWRWGCWAGQPASCGTPSWSRRSPPPDDRRPCLRQMSTRSECRSAPPDGGRIGWASAADSSKTWSMKCNWAVSAF